MNKCRIIAAPGRSRQGVLAVLAGLSLLAGCQTYNDTYGTVMGSGTRVTATDSARLTKSGFLSDYARLKPNPAVDGIECWRDTNVDARQFHKVMVSNIMVSIASSSNDETPAPIASSSRRQWIGRLQPLWSLAIALLIVVFVWRQRNELSQALQEIRLADWRWLYVVVICSVSRHA